MFWDYTFLSPGYLIFILSSRDSILFKLPKYLLNHGISKFSWLCKNDYVGSSTSIGAQHVKAQDLFSSLSPTPLHGDFSDDKLYSLWHHTITYVTTYTILKLWLTQLWINLRRILKGSGLLFLKWNKIKQLWNDKLSY